MCPTNMKKAEAEEEAREKLAERTQEQVLRDRLAAANTEVKALRRELGQQDVIANVLERSISCLPMPRKPARFEAKTKRGVRYDAALLLGDHHFPEIVKAAATGGLSAFDPETCLNRLWSLGEKLVKVVDNERKASHIDDLWILGLGDLGTGEIWPDLLRATPVPFLQSISQYAAVVAQFINGLAEHFRKIRVIFVPGNHTRIGRQISYKQFAENNGDVLLGDMVNAYLRDQVKSGRIEIHLPRALESIVIIQDHPFLVGHGHGIRAWGGFPVYGIFRDTARQREMRQFQEALPEVAQFKDLNEAVAWAREILGRMYQYRIMGHWHSYHILFGGRVIINGALIGANEFSVASPVSAADKPVQVLMLVSREFLPGPIWPIDLSRSKKHRFTYNTDLWGSEIAQEASM
jgi:hypothetical protein